MRIAVLESLGISKDALDQYEKALKDMGHDLVSFSRTADEETLIKEGADAEAVILANMPIPERVIRAWTDVRYIDIAFTGVDHVAVAAAKEQGILLSNASGYSTEAVAELTLGQMLSLIRNVKAVETRCREGKDKTGLIGGELAGKTVGVVGYGKIGARVAALCEAFGCRVLATSATRTEGASGTVRFCPLSQLLRESDIVTLHCPLNAETRGLIGEEALGRMKRSAYLVNMARGPVVDTAALKNALTTGKISGAAVDVFDVEPPLPGDHPLLDCPNLLLTPHVAFATAESMEKRAKIVFDNLFAYLKGEHRNAV